MIKILIMDDSRPKTETIKEIFGQDDCLCHLIILVKGT